MFTALPGLQTASLDAESNVLAAELQDNELQEQDPYYQLRSFMWSKNEVEENWERVRNYYAKEAWDLFNKHVAAENRQDAALIWRLIVEREMELLYPLPTTIDLTPNDEMLDGSEITYQVQSFWRDILITLVRHNMIYFNADTENGELALFGHLKYDSLFQELDQLQLRISREIHEKQLALLPGALAEAQRLRNGKGKQAEFVQVTLLTVFDEIYQRYVQRIAEEIATTEGTAGMDALITTMRNNLGLDKPPQPTILPPARQPSVYSPEEVQNILSQNYSWSWDIMQNGGFVPRDVEFTADQQEFIHTLYNTLSQAQVDDTFVKTIIFTVASILADTKSYATSLQGGFLTPQGREQMLSTWKEQFLQKLDLSALATLPGYKDKGIRAIITPIFDAYAKTKAA